MSAFSKLFAEIYRDFLTADTPSSGANKPKKEYIRTWGATAERLLLRPARIVTVAGAVTVDPGDTFIVVRKSVGEPTNVNLCSSAAFLGDELTIKYVEADLVANPCTALPAAETIDGMASVPITTNYGLVKLKPDPAGGWFLTQYS